MASELLYGIALLARRRYRLIFLCTAVVLVGSFLLALRLDFDTQYLNLLPQDDPVVQTFRSTLEEFGSLDFLLVVVRIPEGAVVDPYETFVGELGATLEGLDELEYVDYRLGEMEDLVSSFFPKAFLFLDAQSRRTVEGRLTDEGIERRIQEIRRLLATPQSLVMGELLRLDPFGLSEVFLDQLTNTRGAMRVDWTSGFFLSKDRRRLLLIAKPVRPAQDVEFDLQLMASLERVVSEVEGRWEAIAGPQPPPLPQVAFGGSYVTALEDASSVRRDIVLNALTAMVGVLLLFLVAFRRIGLLLYAFFPLFCGLVVTFGFAAASLGALNSATSGFAALLVGLGIDFVIVSYGRYVEERRSGSGLAGALRKMCGESGRAVVTGGVTTAATFYAFGVTEFTGLRQMGFLTGTGILFCMLAVLLLLPAMLAWSEDHHERRERRPTFYLHGFGTRHLIRFCLRHPRPVLASGLIITLIAAALALRLEFVDSIRQMRPKGNPGVQVQEEVAEHFGSGFDYMMLVLEGDSLAEVLNLADRAGHGARDLVERGELNGFDSVTNMVPPPRQQEQALAWLRDGRGDRLNVSRIEATLAKAAKAEGLRLEPFSTGLDLLERAVDAERHIGIEDFAQTEQTQHLLDRYLRQADSGWKSVVYLYPPPRIWKRQAPPGVEALAMELGPRAVLSGVNLVSETLRRQVKLDAIVAAVVGFVVVALLLWLDYRRLDDTIMSLAPLGVGLVWMLGAMSLLSLNLNFFNIFVSTMVIGIGVDYGVHMMHRSREIRSDSTQELGRGLVETGRAIVMAALSTMVGFGSLSLSHYPGLRSMGLVAILGAFSTALVAVTLLPAALALRSRARGS